MESIIVIVGFLGAGKTTLLKYLIGEYLGSGWNPYVILNDYENAYLDAQQLPEAMPPDLVIALSGSCICCSGITELRDAVNRIPAREQGVTLIEANGTSDAVSLMGFLGVGLHERFRPPVQISVVDVRNWQLREAAPPDLFGRSQDSNELEASQIQVSSLVLMNHLETVSDERRRYVEADIRRLNPYAVIVAKEELKPAALADLAPSTTTASSFDHTRSHWASCSVDLPGLTELACIQKICDEIPASILRIKGCTKVGDSEEFTFFERCPDGQVYVRPYRGVPITGAKLLAVGPGSDPAVLSAAIDGALESATASTETL